MFSYRHAFHAGNHADVLKHMVLLAVLRHLTHKDTALLAVDTHAGAGLYRLDRDYAQTSAESAEGYLRLLQAQGAAPPLVQDYLDMVAAFRAAIGPHTYPGSPFIMQKMLRPQDRIKLFELHPTDTKTLMAHVAQLDGGPGMQVLREDGFEGLKKLLPPPSRRGLVLCDPSYEIKTDYTRVGTLLADALKRFATGVYVVWHPVIGRSEAHDLPRKLRTLATKASKPWLHATLTVKSGKVPSPAVGGQRPGMPASGVFVVNPPHTLQGALREALPYLATQLGQDGRGLHSLDVGG